MKKAMIVGITALLLNILLPVTLLDSLRQTDPETVVLMIDEPKAEIETAEQIILGTEKGNIGMDLEEYLVNVVLSEMPGSFELEALKAQAVAARTFACRQMHQRKHQTFDLCTQSTCCQAWYPLEILMAKMGSSAEESLEKARRAVKETAGLALTYEGEWIDAVYFSCSGGTTEDAVAVWGSEVPYLQSVPSLGEEASSKFHSVVMVSFSDFCDQICAENPAVVLDGAPDEWIGMVHLTEGGGVDTITIGEEIFTGTQLRRMFHLNSTKFSMEVREQEIVFYVQGYGHRVGMSQYGANAMAKAGKTFQEILQYYYKDVKLERKTP